jgi:hypothetical protein
MNGLGLDELRVFYFALKVRAAPFFSSFWCVCAKFCAVGIYFIFKKYSVEMFFLLKKTQIVKNRVSVRVSDDGSAF